jgi:hypothetical protein
MNKITCLYLCASWAVLKILESIELDLRKTKVDWGGDSLVELWLQKISLLHLDNCGITILPFKFWKEIGIWYKRDWRRFYLGVGLFSFFVSFRRPPKETPLIRQHLTRRKTSVK